MPAVLVLRAVSDSGTNSGDWQAGEIVELVITRSAGKVDGTDGRRDKRAAGAVQRGMHIIAALSNLHAIGHAGSEDGQNGALGEIDVASQQLPLLQRLD